jgi:hypothetical protein
VQANFKPESVRTEADESNDIRSLRRHTQSWLYLATKRSTTPDERWRLPSEPVATNGGDSIRAGAQRAIAAALGNSVEIFIFGNKPAGHVEGGENEKTFLMLGIVLDGLPDLNKHSKVTDFAWLTRGEVLEAYSDDPDAAGVLETLLVE